ncbi:MAG: condensation domain-containing protein, partial [Acidobacteriota bacterium]|nr:condensation domain-containing protein [Acidobacteriota bacterium]
VQRSAYEPVTALAEQQDYELSPAQRRFWVHDRLSDAAPGGAPPTSFLFEGPLNVEALEAAFRTLVERHEILRTVFVTSGTEPRQKIVPAARAPLHLELLDFSDAADPQEKVASVERREATTAMELSRGPLFRVNLIRLAETRHVCVCTMHHIISDGWSAEVLLDELGTVYEAFASGKPNPLAPLDLQYRDYAYWLNRLLAGPRGEQMKSYWLGKLGGAPARLNLRPDSNGASGRGYKRRTFRFTIPQEAGRPLESTGRRYGATLFMTLSACIKALLYRHTGQEDIVVGSAIAGRVHAEMERQVGPYLNVLALRDQVQGGERFDALLERVRETTLDAYANQLYPFDWLLEGLGVRRERGRNPLFDVGFTFQSQRRSSAPRRSADVEISELPGTDIETQNAEALTQFWFLGEEGPDALRMTVVYDGASFEESTMRRLAEDLCSIVEAVGQDPGVRINRLQLSRQVRSAVGAGKVTIELGTH